MEALTLERAALDAIFAHARATHPDECCGAVVAADGRQRVHRFTNIQGRLHAADPAAYPRDAATAYTPEPKELLAAFPRIERTGEPRRIRSNLNNGLKALPVSLLR